VTGSARFYLNGEGLDAPAGSSLLDAIQSAKPVDAAAVRQGEMVITDSRGLPAQSTTVIYNGAIFRLIRKRSRDNEETSEL